MAQLRESRIESAVSFFDSGDIIHRLDPLHGSPIHQFIEG